MPPSTSQLPETTCTSADRHLTNHLLTLCRPPLATCEVAGGGFFVESDGNDKSLSVRIGEFL
ncbi:hypothetical protein LUD75_14765 [Epilithonimonas sp. JDS]|uniref:hypothetical protein n=1 Tax=Epilithonimonas sp. JDS TaxID=2902797 RepID=UPI001E5D6313|nr:hypothetical protein [Epilithonimonas sp. JDS]MCD9855986.1 hypothetical protein [Epilithonimonas sp. JDS]